MDIPFSGVVEVDLSSLPPQMVLWTWIWTDTLRWFWASCPSCLLIGQSGSAQLAKIHLNYTWKGMSTFRTPAQKLGGYWPDLPTISDYKWCRSGVHSIKSAYYSFNNTVGGCLTDRWYSTDRWSSVNLTFQRNIKIFQRKFFHLFQIFERYE